MVQFTNLLSVIKSYNIRAFFSESVLALILWILCDWLFNFSYSLVNITEPFQDPLAFILYVSFVMSFYLIALEDYKTGYVDVRKCIVLFIFSFILQKEYVTFIFSVFCGAIFFLILFISQIRYEKIQIYNEHEDVNNKAYTSFIPSFWMGTIIAFSCIPSEILNYYDLNLKTSELLDIIRYILNNHYVLLAFFSLLVAFYIVFTINRYNQKTCNGYEAVSGLGAGDAMFLPIFMGIFGWPKFFIVMLISNVLHLIFNLLSKNMKSDKGAKKCL